MAISNEGLIVILVVGLIAGWLAGQLVQGTGFGIIGDIIIGIIGAFIGAWLFLSWASELVPALSTRSRPPPSARCCYCSFSGFSEEADVGSATRKCCRHQGVRVGSGFKRQVPRRLDNDGHGHPRMGRLASSQTGITFARAGLMAYTASLHS